MHDSFTPIGGMVPLVNMQMGEVIFGGVGAGLYGMMMMVLLTVFIAGLMVGRTPEYLGKKVESREVRMVMLYVLVFPLVILVPTGLSVVLPRRPQGPQQRGPHGLTEILYAFTSTPANNGSAFAGLTGSDILLQHPVRASRRWSAASRCRCRCWPRRGFLAEKRIAPESAGTFPVTTPLFVVLLISVILIVGALTFFPAWSLGPIVEHLLMQSGRLF